MLHSVLLAAILLFGPLSAVAQSFDSAAEHAILVDLSTDTVLFEKNADARMPTSSMSKVMTMFMVFEALRDGRLKLDDTLPVSEKAWRKGGSKMFVEVGKRVRVEDLVRGVIVQSGNDATIVLAEGLAGDEDAFARMMTDRAQALGMADSNFMNASGWPDPDHYSTARDLATLASAIIRTFPEYYHYYSERSFTFNDIAQPNRNPLVQQGIADGIKTGHTEAAGYGLMASAERDGRRLVAVVNGLASERQRAIEAERLLNWGFRTFDTYAFFEAGEAVYQAPVWLGQSADLPLVIGEEVRLTLPRRLRERMEVTVTLTEPVPAPIAADDRLATLHLKGPDGEIARYPLRAAETVEELGAIDRLQAAARYLVFGTAAAE